jgi:hypothetical protein
MTSETLVNIDRTTQRNNPEDRNLHTRNRPDDGGSLSSETLVNIDRTTQRKNPEDTNLHTHSCENLKSYKCTVQYLRTNKRESRREHKQKIKDFSHLSLGFLLITNKQMSGIVQSFPQT